MYKKIFITFGLAVAISGCSMTLGCPTGQTAVSLDGNGDLVYTKVMGKCSPASGPSESISSGLMIVPLPGAGWNKNGE